ncbi:MAG TPA: MG2 domain-containing protein, partial [Salinarimonas sp.]|nr:MG2 domain-containing protein [Salinarimonas sp.]
MRHFIRAAAFAAALLVAGQAWAQKSFVRDDLASEGVRLEERLRVDAASTAAGRPAAQLRREAEAAMGRSDHRRALALASAAVAADPRDAANWLTYSKAARAVDPRNWTERYELQERATAAAYVAYQRAGSRADEAAALVQLAEAFEARSMWRPAINAYKASLDLVDTPRTRQAYETAREKHGFRILDYKVESDLAAPRVCFQFSEALARGRVDFAPFVAVTGTSGTAVTTEGQQLCVEGLRHGERYGFVLRQGLPSGIGETLLKNADYEVYVRDRSPQARFTGRNYVLPRTGQEGIPVVTVNMDKAAVEVFRIGDRNLLPTLRSDNFLAPLSRTAAGQIAREKGVKIWSGTLDVRNETNRDVVTAFPVTEAAGALQPGVYIMTARPPTGEPANDAADDTDFETVATQWFVVSDLGLTVLKGEDGVHVLARGLGDAKPLKGVEVRLVARNNEILGSRTTDENGHARFDPGLARGNGGMSPGLVTATLAGDYGFLDLQLAAFDLSDRGVKGRAATGALEAFVFPERGAYRSGETVYLTALLRDLRGAGVGGLPLTLVVRRPDGVEHRRAVVEDGGLGGRAFSLPLMGGAMRGTWRVTAFVDPKGPAVGEATFLVEDYVPERLELTLTSKAPVLRAGQPAVVDVEARYLFGAPGAALEVTGEVVVEASAGGLPGLAGYQVGLDDEPFEASRSEIEDKGTTDARGQVTMQIPVPDAAAPRPTEARIALRV